MSLSKKNTTLIVARCLLLEQLRKADPTEIVKVTPNFVTVYDELTDGEGNSTEVTEINWEYALFEATDYELQKLFNNFVSKRKEETKQLENEVAE